MRSPCTRVPPEGIVPEKIWGSDLTVPSGQLRPAARHAMTLVINLSCAQVFDLAQRAEGFDGKYFASRFQSCKTQPPILGPTVAGEPPATIWERISRNTLMKTTA